MFGLGGGECLLARGGEKDLVPSSAVLLHLLNSRCTRLLGIGT